MDRLRALMIVVLGLSGILYDARSANAISSAPIARAAPVAAVYSGIRLPYPNGLAYQVTQGPGGTFSHNQQPNLWAYDFGMPVGHVVSAVRHGTIIRSVFTSNRGGCSDAYRGLENFVVLDHGDGRSSVYAHLEFNSEQVPSQTFVYQGRPIGRVGLTGHVCGAHLHFAVQATPPPGVSFTDSVRASFDEVGEPPVGGPYVSQNRRRFAAQLVSQSPSVTLASGQLHQFVGEWKNVGWDLWLFNVAGNSARLGTWGPTPGQDQPSLLGGAPGCAVVTDWLACNRIRPSTDQVDPDQSAWFAFNVRGPSSPGTYDLYLRPLVEGVTWMEDVAHWRADVLFVPLGRDTP